MKIRLKVIKNRKLYIGIALTLAILSLFIIIFKGLNYGIDFSGGNLIQVKFDKSVTLEDINENLDKFSERIPHLDPYGRKIQISDGNTVILRTLEISDSEKEEVLESFKELGNYTLEKEEKVGASVGDDLKSSAIYSLLIGAALIILYITIRFEFIFSIGAILALIIDLTVSIGVISLLGYEVNTPFIASVLTILGYSINDTIVIFDRIRENIRGKKKTALEDILTESVDQVIVRSLNTSLTTLIAIFALLVLGGDSLRTFITTLLVGISMGTFTSLFVTTPIIYYLFKSKKSKGNGILKERVATTKGKGKNNQNDDDDKILV